MTIGRILALNRRILSFRFSRLSDQYALREPKTRTACWIRVSTSSSSDPNPVMIPPRYLNCSTLAISSPFKDTFVCVARISDRFYLRNMLSAFWPLRLLTAPVPTPPHHLALCIETPVIVGNLRSQTSQAWGSSNAITSDSVVDDTDSFGVTVIWTVFGTLILILAVCAATSLKFCSCVWLFSMLVLKLATSSAYDNSSRSQFGTLGICQPWPGVVRFQMELRQRMKRIGLKMSPCSTPLLIGKASESVPLMPLMHVDAFDVYK